MKVVPLVVFTIAIIVVLCLPIANTTENVVFEELWAKFSESSYSASAHCVVAYGDVVYIASNRSVLVGFGFKHYLRIEARNRFTGDLLSYWEKEIKVQHLNCVVGNRALYVAGVIQYPNSSKNIGILIALSLDLTPLKEITVDRDAESGALLVETSDEYVYVVTYAQTTGNGVEYRLEVRDSVELELVKNITLLYKPSAVKLNPVTMKLWVVGYEITSILDNELQALLTVNIGGYGIDFDEKGYAYVVKGDGLVKVSSSGLVVREFTRQGEPGEFIDVCYMDEHIFVVEQLSRYGLIHYYDYYIRAYNEELTPVGSQPLESKTGIRVQLRPGKMACSEGIIYTAGWYQRGQFTDYAILALKPVKWGASAITATPTPETATLPALSTTQTNTLTPQRPTTVIVTPTLTTDQVTGIQKYAPPFWWLGLAVTLVVFAIMVGPTLISISKKKVKSSKDNRSGVDPVFVV